MEAAVQPTYTIVQGRKLPPLKVCDRSQSFTYAPIISEMYALW